MYGKVKEHLAAALENLKQAGLYKEERIIESPQQAAIQVNGKEVLNFCANNYLGLSNHPPHRGCKEDDGSSRFRYVVCTLHLRYTGHPQGA